MERGWVEFYCLLEAAASQSERTPAITTRKAGRATRLILDLTTSQLQGKSDRGLSCLFSWHLLEGTSSLGLERHHSRRLLDATSN